MNVNSVVRPLFVVVPYEHMKGELTLDRNLTHVNSVVRRMVILAPCEHMKGFTLVRNPMNVNVVRPLLTPVFSESIKELTPERNPMNANSVVRPMLMPHPSNDIRECTLEKPYECKPCYKPSLTPVVFSSILTLRWRFMKIHNTVKSLVPFRLECMGQNQ